MEIDSFKNTEINVHWSDPDIGFGHLWMGLKKDGKLYIDLEGQTREGAKDILSALVDLAEPID